MATYWTTKSGEKIDVDSMSLEHLRNVLKMIINQSEQRKAKNIKLKNNFGKSYLPDICDATEIDLY